MNTNLTKDELAVLKACNLEPGILTNIAREARINQTRAKEILRKLKTLGLVYCEGRGNLKIWSATTQGTKYSV